ncbi:MAG: hypothetical protein ACE5E0_06175 [Terriglobia bacterium]
MLKNNTIQFMLFILGCVLLAHPVQAQDERPVGEQPVRVVLNDGSKLVGTIIERGEEFVVFRTVSGVEMSLLRDQIKDIKVLKGSIVEGHYRRTDPNRTRLFFSPTARSLGGGSGYFSLYEIFFPYVSVGVGDVITAGGGVSLVPGTKQQLLYGATKLTLVEKRGVALAAGGFVATITSGEGSGGALFGLGTFGGDEAALTLGLGFAFGNGDFAESPSILIGGEYQVSNNIKLLSENYILPDIEDGLLFSGGIRFIGERISADFALFSSPSLLEEAEGFPFLPWVGFAYNFGR